jgi:transcriptional regulator with XRE-family HTH domain
MAPKLATVAEIIRTNLRIELARTDISQRALAEHVSMSQQALSRKLSGEVDWRLGELILIALALDVALSVLVPDSITEAAP